MQTFWLDFVVLICSYSTDLILLAEDLKCFLMVLYRVWYLCKIFSLPPVPPTHGEQNVYYVALDCTQPFAVWQKPSLSPLKGQKKNYISPHDLSPRRPSKNFCFWRHPHVTINESSIFFCDGSCCVEVGVKNTEKIKRCVLELCSSSRAKFWQEIAPKETSFWQLKSFSGLTTNHFGVCLC